MLNPEKSKEFLKTLSCIYNEGGFLQNAETLEKLTLALGSKEEVRSYIRALAKKNKDEIPDDLLRLMLGMGEDFKEFNLFKNERGLIIAVGIGKPALHIIEKGFDTGNLELKAAAVKAAGRIGKPALPSFKKFLKTKNLEPKIRIMIKHFIRQYQ